MSEPIFTEQKIMDKVSKCDFSTYQKLLPEIKEAAKKTGDPSLAPVIQFERISSSINQNHGLSKDQVAYMAVDREIAETVKKSPDSGKLLNPLRYNLGLTNINLEFNPGKNEELINNLNKSLYLMASPFLTERIASLITKYGKESKDAVAQKEKTDKQIWAGMVPYLNMLMLNQYSVLSAMLLKNISDKTIKDSLEKDIDTIKKDIESAEKEGKKMDTKKAKNELEFLIRLANPEGLTYAYQHLGVQKAMVPPKHVKQKLEDMQDVKESGKLMLAAKNARKSAEVLYKISKKYIRANEKKIVKDLTEAMEKFRQA